MAFARYSELDARIPSVALQEKMKMAARFVLQAAICLALFTLVGCSQAQDREHRQLAEEYARKGEIQPAIAELGRIKHSTSDDLSARGELLIQLGRPQFEEAAKAFQGALRLDKQSARAFYGLGLLAASKADFTEAEAFFRKALAIQPTAVHAQNALAGVLTYQGNYAEAERLYLALEGNPTVGSLVLGNLGELYLRQGKLDLAEAKLKEAIVVLPGNFDWHRHLAEVYRLQGRNTNAASEYRRALELLATSPAADRSLTEELAGRLREVEQR